MSMDPNAPYQSSGVPAGAPQKGGGSKVLLGLGIGCGLMLLLCCGGGIAFFYTTKDQIKQVVENTFQVEQDPVKVKAISDGITDMQAPEGLHPDSAVTINVPFTDQKLMTVANYVGPNQKGILIVAEFGQQMAGADPEEMKRKLQDSMQQHQGGQGAKELQLIGEPREVTATVRDQAATFKIQKGRTENGDEYYQVQGVFQGKGGPGFLMGQFPADQIDEEQTEAFVRSVK